MLSTITDWPSTGASAWASIRADRSVVPPAAVGTTMVTFLVGYVPWADALVHRAVANAPSARVVVNCLRVMFMSLSPCCC
ncbi:hypothetical protein D3C71_1739490 [compost metagenome]